MDVFTANELRTLLEARDGAHVSIFMPTHQVGTDAEEDRIRLKNLLRDAEIRLSSQGVRPLLIEKMLAPAQERLSDALFWQYQSGGLALFLSPDFSRFYRLPLNFKELVVVADRFHVKPVLPLVSGDGRFYILAISGDQVRLLRGTRDRVDQIQVKDVPANLSEALKYEDAEKQFQFHTDAQVQGTRRRAAVFYGQGDAAEDWKDDLFEYFRQIDRGLHSVLKDERVPLVLAGVDYLFPIYREANTYPYLLGEGISGNPERLSAAELHDRAVEVLQPYFARSREEAVARYRELAGTERVSEDIEAIVPAAVYGRVETLFVAVGSHQWGRYNPSADEVILDSELQPGDEDLLDLASVHTILNRGTVYAVEAGQVPGGLSVAAVLRY